MNNIKSNFSIKDLENLSGVRAHTIRIWEKRYNLLNPDRTQTNIRTYTIESLQKLLNVSYLNSNGYKISKIAVMDKDQLNEAVKSIASLSECTNHSLTAFKLAMLNFDQRLFDDTYQNLIEKKDFDEVFTSIIIPLLNEIGMLWQTDTITPANEHFMSSLVRQKILIKIEELQNNLRYNNNKVFVLFLPNNEIHELGLMYLQYQLLKFGHQTIYLGQSVPMESLIDLLKCYDVLNFVSFFTVMPETGKVADYISTFNDKILTKGDHKLLLLGRKLAEVKLECLPSKVEAYTSIESLVDQVAMTRANVSA